MVGFNQMVEMILILNTLLSVILTELWEKLFSEIYGYYVTFKKDKVNLLFK